MPYHQEEMDPILTASYLSLFYVFYILCTPSRERLNLLTSMTLFHYATALPAVLDSNDLNGTNGLIIEGAASGDLSGHAIVGLDNFMGNASTQIVISSPQAMVSGRQNSGYVDVIFSKDFSNNGSLALDALNASDKRRILGESAGDFFGSSITTVMSLNNDDSDDLCIAAETANSTNGLQSGKVICAFAPPQIWPSDLDSANYQANEAMVLLGATAGDLFGSSLTALTNFTGSLVPMIAIGARHASPFGRMQAGLVYFAFDFSESIINSAVQNTTQGIRYFGRNDFDFTGAALSAGRDANHDGKNDCLIGSWGLSPGNQSQAGGADLIFGYDGPFVDVDMQTLQAGTQSVCFQNSEAQGNAGFSVLLEDINGDGIADVIIGAPGATVLSRTQAGKIVIFFGRSNWQNSCYDFSQADSVIHGPSAFAKLGQHLCRGGDFNADGFQDFLSTAPFASPATGSQAGIGYVFYGRPSWQSSYDTANLSAQDATEVYGRSANTKLESCAFVGDQDGNGIPDIAFGAPQALTNAGETVLIYGEQDFRFTQQAPSSQRVSQATSASSSVNSHRSTSHTLSQAVALSAFSSVFHPSSASQRISSHSTVSTQSFSTEENSGASVSRQFLSGFYITSPSELFVEIGIVTFLTVDLFVFPEGVTPSATDTFQAINSGIEIYVDNQQQDLFTYAELVAGDVQLLVPTSYCFEELDSVEFQSSGSTYAGIMALPTNPTDGKCNELVDATTLVGMTSLAML